MKKKKFNLTTRIMLSLILGAIVGSILYFLPASSFKTDILVNGIFYIVGNGFIRMMQMLVVPLVFVSIVCGSAAIGDTKTLGKVGVRSLIFYLCTTAIAVVVAIGVANIINPGIGVKMANIVKTATSATSSTKSVSFAETILNIIPTNPIESLSNGTMLQIIFFALLLGIILAKLGDRVDSVSQFFNQWNTIMMEMTNIIMLVAPIGVFALIAKTFATLGFDMFLPMLKYMGSVVGGLGIHCIVVYMALLKIFTGLNPVRFIKKFFPVMTFAFSTATSNATIPLSIETLEKKVGVSKKISSFTIPLGATINMDGTAIMQGVAVVFTAQLFNINLSVADYLTVIATATLASVGTAGVPSVGLITLSMVFSSVGLPVEGIAYIMGIDRILDMLRTAVNITGDAVCTTIVAHQNKALNKEVFYQE
ncbi:MULTISPECIES: dicarboxylate/amino acid:cation symporter [Coprobacillaceae]|uniref:dicarboxylate/amino acid:cation symporter n=1 Tax=Coprobacillaceae TaxID=2810280 RepID=UPI000E47F178|nr:MULTISPECIES: dicarboxylate/amino acid:cation symporter [Coprobacillaceae]RHM61301.1 dicarboxylate/amino acid:cation symporter [Coprobacillus sp. AF33-1AC]RHS95882.1 dicarboxylate/amino acid:cation symporter [Erysipelatoclostridium sp. AM42-17]